MAINGTLELIDSVTVGSGGAASIEFTSIPQTYDDLQIVISARTNRAASPLDAVNIEFNSSSANLSYRDISGNGSTTASASSATVGRVALVPALGATSSTFGNASVYIPNYRTSNNKSWSADNVTENNATEAWSSLIAGLWANSAAITSLKLLPLVGTLFLEHSTAYLYGVSRVPAGAKATGGVIYSDNDYWYHTFTSSGVFTPSENLTCDYIVVAGGGSSGYSSYCGGGGAGGYRAINASSFTSSTNYTVTIGAGGAAIASAGSKGNNGSNSSFNSTAVTGGGGGGSYGVSSSYWNGSNGGSGGGGSADTGTGGTGTSGEGNNGGSGNSYGGGAGGGSGGVGTSYTSSTYGLKVAGGVGTTSSISGASTTYATGGYGRSQNPADSATNGTAYTGNGGGGGDSSSGAGGSGIVIVRYAK